MKTSNPELLERAAQGGPASPLTPKQRRLLVVRSLIPAYRHMRAKGLAGEDFNGWRHEEIFKACHKSGLTEATQADFNLIKAHCLRVMGRREEAAAAEHAASTEGWRIACWHLRKAMDAAQDVIYDPVGYVRSICLARYKTADSRAVNARQMWGLVYDLRRAAQRRRAKAI